MRGVDLPAWAQAAAAPLESALAQHLGPDVALPVALLLSLLLALATVALVGRMALGGAAGGSAAARRGDAVLLLGQCGSGKSALLYRLAKDAFPDLVTSMEVHEMTTAEGKRLVDFPGHARLRSDLPAYVAQAARVVFVVDGTDKSEAHLRELADLIYDVLTECIRAGVEPRVMIAVNKSDLGGCMATADVRKRLEKELDGLKSTRHSLETEGDEGLEIVLGTEGAPFDFDNDAGCEVDFCTMSVKEDKLDELLEWLQ